MKFFELGDAVRYVEDDDSLNPHLYGEVVDIVGLSSYEVRWEGYGNTIESEIRLEGEKAEIPL